MRVLAIDIGTNSTLHLIADVEYGSAKAVNPLRLTADGLTVEPRISLVERGITGNNLGFGIDSDGRLGKELIAENRRILTDLVTHGRELGCIRIGAVGTHALRQAINRNDFVAMAAKAGVPLEIISDEEEAQLAWQGVFNCPLLIDNYQSSIVNRRLETGLLDIGGGSSELSIGEGLKTTWSSSIPYAAVNVSRKYFQHDPPKLYEIETARNKIKKEFITWEERLPHGSQLVGIAGTIVSLAAIEYGIKSYQPGLLEGLTLNSVQIHNRMGKLLKMNLEERRAIPGMPPARAGSIHGGALILDQILKIIDTNCIITSEKGLLFGLVVKLSID